MGSLTALRPMSVGWIVGICSYELLQDALRGLGHAEAISAIGCVFVLGRCVHAFHSHDTYGPNHNTLPACNADLLQPTTPRFGLTRRLQQHVAFGLHVFIDTLLIGLAYNTPTFLGAALALGMCVVQDAAVLALFLMHTGASRPRLQASASVSLVACCGMAVGAVVPVPPIASAVASSCSIGLLACEMVDAPLPHEHGMRAVKQTVLLTAGAAIAFTFSLL